MKKIINYVLYIVNTVTPKKSNKITFCSYPDYSDNSKALFEYIRKNYVDKFELVWIAEDETMVRRLNELGISTFRKNSIRGILNIITSKYLVTTHNECISIKSKNQIYISLWHGMPLKNMAFMEAKGNIKGNTLKRQEKESKKIDFLISTSKIMKLAMSSCFFIDPRKVITLGQPRNDYLFKKENKLKYLFGDVNLKEYKKIILYAPTFKSGKGRTDGISSNNKLIDLKNYDEDELIRFLKKENYLLVLKLHPFEEKNLKHIESKYIKILKNNEMKIKLISLNEILNSIDLLITDYSSIYFDYLILNKPILFIDTDIEQYSKKRGFLLDKNEFWRPGPIIKESKSFMVEVNRLLKDESYYRQERQLINSMINVYNDENSSERIFNRIILK